MHILGYYFFICLIVLQKITKYNANSEQSNTKRMIKAEGIEMIIERNEAFQLLSL